MMTSTSHSGSHDISHVHDVILGNVQKDDVTSLQENRKPLAGNIICTCIHNIHIHVHCTNPVAKKQHIIRSRFMLESTCRRHQSSPNPTSSTTSGDTARRGYCHYVIDSDVTNECSHVTAQHADAREDTGCSSVCTSTTNTSERQNSWRHKKMYMIERQGHSQCYLRLCNTSYRHSKIQNKYPMLQQRF